MVGLTPRQPVMPRVNGWVANPPHPAPVYFGFQPGQMFQHENTARPFVVPNKNRGRRGAGEGGPMFLPSPSNPVTVTRTRSLLSLLPPFVPPSVPFPRFPFPGTCPTPGDRSLWLVHLGAAECHRMVFGRMFANAENGSMEPYKPREGGCCAACWEF